MSHNIWSFQYGDELFNAPTVNGNKCTVNDIKLIDAVHNHLNCQALSNELNEYIDKYALGRLKVAENTWQEQEENRYVRMDLTHCENYGNYILLFHDADNQYGFFFINMNKSVDNDECSLYFDREREPNGYKEWIWGSTNDVDIIYSPENDDELKQILGFKDTVIHYLMKVNNIRLGEFIALENDTFIILFHRLRARVRNGFHGKIISVQGIIPQSVWDGMCEKLEDITDEDEEYSTNTIMKMRT